MFSNPIVILCLFFLISSISGTHLTSELCANSSYSNVCVQLGKKSYLIDGDAELNWFNADRFCRRQNAVLANIETSHEYDLIMSYLTTQNYLNSYYWFWIGGHDLGSEGYFYSSKTGNLMPYTKWTPGQPDQLGVENCVSLWKNFETYGMNNLACTSKVHYICELAFVDNTHLQTLYLSNNPQLSDIPMRLFQGNPNILDVHMQNNNLQTLYAAQFPVDQLERLYLGDNPLQCNCSLLWLWRLVTGNYDETTSQSNINGGPTITHGSAAVAALEEPRHADAPDAAPYVADREEFTEQLEQTNGGSLKLDIEHIGCDVWQDSLRTRRQLATMSESEITCPAHIVTIVCAILTCLVVILTGASIVFYLRFVKRRRKLLHDRSTLRSGKSIVNVHDRILQHQPLSGGGTMGSNGGIGGGTLSSLNGMGIYPHHTLQSQLTTHHGMHAPLHHDYQQTLPQVDKLELERYLTAQAIANEYRALKPWELPPVKDAVCYSDEPEHLYEKFDHYEYPDTQSMTKSKQTTLKSLSNAKGNGSNCSGGGGGGGGGGSNSMTGNGTIGGKPHVVYV